MDCQLYVQKMKSLKQIQQDSHHALRIAICGKFKSGKSSLLNLMLGTNLPVRSTTATGIVTKIVYGNASAVKMESEEIKSASVQELYDYISVVDKSLDGIATSDARCAYIGSYSKLLKYGKVEFWDTPGLEDDPELTRITMEAINQCDFLIYVMHANQVLSQYEKRLFSKLDKLMNGNIIFVVNHMDSLRSDEREAVIRTVNHALARYHNRFFPDGNVFFTSASTDHPDISLLLNEIIRICSQKEIRIDIMNETKKGKSLVLEEEWNEIIAEDIEEIEQNIRELQRLIQEDVERKREQIVKAYQFCVNRCRRIQNSLESAIQDESAWRKILIDYQSVSGWEKSFVNGSSERIKGRMAQLIQQGNKEIYEAVQGSIFESDGASLVLVDWVVWRKANWYRNFSRPLFFPEARFKQFRNDCVESCISALMENPVVVVRDRIQTFFSSLFSAFDDRYETAVNEVKGEPDLLEELENARSARVFVENCQISIAAIQEDIQQAEQRNRLSYKMTDFFSSFFHGMLSEEIYG